LLPPLARLLLSGRPNDWQARAPNLGFVILASGWCVLFFSLSGSKLPTYIMPAFPPLALALGYVAVHGRRSESRWPAGLAAASFVVLALGHNLLMPWYANYRAPLARADELQVYFDESRTPIFCYPRNCDSLSFRFQRDDLRCYRSKQTHLLVYEMQQRPRTIVVCTHRHTLEELRHALTPDLQIVESKSFALVKLSFIPESLMDQVGSLFGETSLGLCAVAVVERRAAHAANGRPARRERAAGRNQLEQPSVPRLY
jgi:hypothetical protein